MIPLPLRLAHPASLRVTHVPQRPSPSNLDALAAARAGRRDTASAFSLVLKRRSSSFVDPTGAAAISFILPRTPHPPAPATPSASTTHLHVNKGDTVHVADLFQIDHAEHRALRPHPRAAALRYRDKYVRSRLRELHAVRCVRIWMVTWAWAWVCSCCGWWRVGDVAPCVLEPEPFNHCPRPVGPLTRAL